MKRIKPWIQFVRGVSLLLIKPPLGPALAVSSGIWFLILQLLEGLDHV